VSTRFAACYLLVFAQLAAGGVAALAVPPFAVLERGFYKSSAAVFVASAALFVVGRAALAVDDGGLGGGGTLELALWAAFTVATGVYLALLWGDAVRRRARAFTVALALGLAALTASATLHRVGPLLSAATILYPLAFVTSALALGAVATGMLLGHWYLIDLGLSIVPLRRLFRYFVWVVVVHAAVLVVTLAALALGPAPAAAAVGGLWHEHAGLLAARFVLGPAAALGLAWLIHRTLLIPQTMAATGLFYIAILFVVVGELIGRLLLYHTSLPL
jgi:hypothetical protein